MWIRLDDGFATHPKILKAGVIALAIQVRAICYASRNRTDGFIPYEAVPLLVTGLERLGIETATIGDYAAAGCDATEIDWPVILIEHRLWEPCPGGYTIHDYLEWNLSKKDYDSWKKKLSFGGKKGMKSRYSKDKSSVTRVITQDITTPVTVSSISISSSLPSPKSEFEQFWDLYPKKEGKIAARKAWKNAKEKPPLDLMRPVLAQAAQSEQWCKENGKYIPQPARWLNEGRWDDQPCELKGAFNGQATIPPFPGPDDPIGRGRWRQAYGDPANPHARH